MSNRRKDAPENYNTPDWVTMGLLRTGVLQGITSVLEPCAGIGNIVACLRRINFDHHITAIEVESEYMECLAHRNPTVLINDDFLSERVNKAMIGTFDLVIINPPYTKIEDFISKAFTFANKSGKVCALLRLGHLAGIKRGKFLREYHPSEVHIFCDRPTFNGTAADIGGYCWVVWDWPLSFNNTILKWIEA